MIAGRVAVGGAVVGVLERLDDDETHRFEFDTGWLADPDRPVLGQQFEDRRPGPLVTSGLPAWFAHLIPPDPLRRAIRRWAGLADDASDLELLLATGADLPGAVTLTPTEPTLRGSPPTQYVPPVGKFAFSLAGAQPKMSADRDDRGLVIPVRGEIGEYIAKFHDPRYAELPRVELATTLWARAAGIATHHVELVRASEFQDLPHRLPVGNGEVLLARRFDRLDHRRIHAEDFGQIAGIAPSQLYSHSYEHLARLVAALVPEDVGEFLARIGFMIASGNGDAHWKNWGVFYTDPRRPRLSPAYDLVSTLVYGDAELEVPIGGRRRFDELDRDAFAGLARAVAWSEAETIRAVSLARERAETVWTEEVLPFTTAERARVTAHHAGLRRW